MNYDLRTLAELNTTERAFLSVYIDGPQSVRALKKRFEKIRRALKGGGAEKDEREHFDENVKAVDDYLRKNPLESGAICIFSCWALDFFQAIPLNAKIENLVWIDSSPYIRPLAEFQDEYENVAVVIADNKKARIYLVSSAVAGDEEVVKGNVKNHVRKGGWSQQRYERRRDKQLLLYSKEIVKALATLDREEDFRRVILVGGKEIMREVIDRLPHSLKDKVSEKALDLGKGEGSVNEDILDLFIEQEHQSEKDLWEKIRSEYLRGGLGVAGLDDVLSAAKEGRIETMVVNRSFKPEGRRCRDCDNLETSPVDSCSSCASNSLYEVDVVNEIVEMLNMSGADADFTDPIETLTEAGNIAALLRY